MQGSHLLLLLAVLSISAKNYSDDEYNFLGRYFSAEKRKDQRISFLTIRLGIKEAYKKYVKKCHDEGKDNKKAGEMDGLKGELNNYENDLRSFNEKGSLSEEQIDKYVKVLKNIENVLYKCYDSSEAWSSQCIQHIHQLKFDDSILEDFANKKVAEKQNDPMNNSDNIVKLYVDISTDEDEEEPKLEEDAFEAAILPSDFESNNFKSKEDEEEEDHNDENLVKLFVTVNSDDSANTNSEKEKDSANTVKLFIDIDGKEVEKEKPSKNIEKNEEVVPELEEPEDDYGIESLFDIPEEPKIKKNEIHSKPKVHDLERESIDHEINWGEIDLEGFFDIPEENAKPVEQKLSEEEILSDPTNNKEELLPEHEEEDVPIEIIDKKPNTEQIKEDELVEKNPTLDSLIAEKELDISTDPIEENKDNDSFNANKELDISKDSIGETTVNDSLNEDEELDISKDPMDKNLDISKDPIDENKEEEENIGDKYSSIIADDINSSRLNTLEVDPTIRKSKIDEELDSTTDADELTIIDPIFEGKTIEIIKESPKRVKTVIIIIEVMDCAKCLEEPFLKSFAKSLEVSKIY
jgi:hypothetical protein